MENSLTTHGRWLSLPFDHPILERVRTRFLPWETLLEELEQRFPFSGYVDVHHGLLSGRIFWQDGQDKGAIMQERSPRATVTDLWWQVQSDDLISSSHDTEISVFSLEPALASLVFQSSFSDSAILEGSLQDNLSKLTSQGFTGVLSARSTSGKASFFWQQGQVVQRLGSSDSQLGDVRLIEVFPAQPYQAANVQSLATASIPLPENVGLGEPSSAGTPPDSTQLIGFWNTALALSGSSSALEGAWRSSAMELSDDHPCLDPFADEVRIEGNRLVLSSEVPFEELQSALRDAYRMTLGKAGIPAKGLDLAGLKQQQSAMWVLSGIDEVLA